MQVELNQIERSDLECYIYEEHKTAFGTKGRHYNFSAMTMDELRAEAEYIADACDKAVAEEEAAKERSLAEFQSQITKVIDAGAGDRTTALRWMTSTETFYSSQDVEYWVWNQGILFTDYGRELVKELDTIVNYSDFD